eukprot:CAMPEP_0177677294 /NCGR_PEP_ID=MMETSP0447-20121125/28303_1 /TAXON_ID=0 /ORGANISM="Stygamoeba regulata, Strain BSH-02190019" /LENGTH=44 /DNA_ID= /DNA_START= /DNA_END= /DNA_ORIENTATION=
MELAISGVANAGGREGRALQADLVMLQAMFGRLSSQFDKNFHTL